MSGISEITAEKPRKSHAAHLRERFSRGKLPWETIENLVDNIEREEQVFRSRLQFNLAKIITEGGELPVQEFSTSELWGVYTNIIDGSALDRRKAYVPVENDRRGRSQDRTRKKASDDANRFLERALELNEDLYQRPADNTRKDYVRLPKNLDFKGMSKAQESEFQTLFEAAMVRFFETLKPRGIYVLKINIDDELADLEEGEKYLQQSGYYLDPKFNWLDENIEVADRSPTSFEHAMRLA